MFLPIGCLAREGVLSEYSLLVVFMHNLFGRLPVHALFAGRCLPFLPLIAVCMYPCHDNRCPVTIPASSFPRSRSVWRHAPVECRMEPLISPGAVRVGPASRPDSIQCCAESKRAWSVVKLIPDSSKTNTNTCIPRFKSLSTRNKTSYSSLLTAFVCLLHDGRPLLKSGFSHACQ